MNNYNPTENNAALVAGDELFRKHHIILFDGVCNFCNSTVNFVIDRDSKKKFKFAPLQSEIAREILSLHKVQNLENYESVILIKNGKIYKKSSAAMEISLDISGLWKVLYAFKIVPWFIRDVFYDLIARNRYRWFGREEACRIPEPGLKDRFLSNN